LRFNSRYKNPGDLPDKRETQELPAMEVPRPNSYIIRDSQG
jgi:hypothetical protein